MKLVSIGFGNLLSAERIIAVISPESAPIKRMIQEVREKGLLIDASFGRSTKSVVTMDSGHVILSALPPEKAFLGDIVLRRAQDRTAFSEKAGTLAVAFRLDASLKGDDAAVTVRDGRAVIRAGRVRGLVFGAGELLRAATWCEEGFSLDDGELAFRPVKPIRTAYWARHFHNWYHLATAAELKEYAEDLALWGVNGFKYQLCFPAVDRAGAACSTTASRRMTRGRGGAAI